MRLTYKMLEQQVKDLRTRLSNAAAKYELKEQALLERIDELNKASGTMPGQISMLQAYISKLEQEICCLKSEIESQKKANIKKDGIIKRFKQIVKKLSARLSKNSSNSDKPPSADVFHKPKTQSLREKSGRKPGGQPGHAGKRLMPFSNPTTVIEKKVEKCGKCGHETESGPKYKARQKIDIRLVLDITEERVYKACCSNCGYTEWAEFSDGYNNHAQYGENLRALVALISEHGSVSVSKTAEIINSLSGDSLHISWGTVVNIQRELSERLEGVIGMIKEGLLAGGVLSADESGCRVNGGLSWVQVFCNDRFTLFSINGKRGEIDNLGVLAYFVGVLIHDHFKSYYNYEQIGHAECNEHILRLLKSLIEIYKHGWLNDMSALLKDACHAKNELMRAGEKRMSDDAVAKFSQAYDEIIKKGKAEYEAATLGGKKKESYYADERRLLTRLEQYKTEHLRFLTDFNVPFTNNLSEQNLRVFKTKLKVAGCFRSDEGAIVYARIMSLIKTLKRQDRNVFEGLRAVFSGSVPISTA